MSIERAAELVQRANSAVVLTGAGISTPSGIPDFRSVDNGIWEKANPLEVASLTAFRLHPERFFAWIRPLLKECLAAAPNAAHIALSALEKAGYVKSIITQNIDGLHQKAGSQFVYEIHGSLDTLTCVHCYRVDDAAAYIGPFITSGTIPRCPDCSHILKPDVILFEEQLPINIWQAAKKAIQNCDVLIVAGSSLEVMPVAGLPYDALSNGAKIIIVNNSPTYIDERAAFIFSNDVAEVLPAIAEAVLGH
jgi:NAD-dependent deacetylase